MRSLCWFSGFDGFEEAMPKSVKSSRFGDFVTLEVRDIEHVYDLVKVRADFGNLQIQLKIKKYFRNVVKQTNSVIGKDGNDRVAFRGAIVESNLGWLCSSGRRVKRRLRFPNAAKNRRS